MWSTARFSFRTTSTEFLFYVNDLLFCLPYSPRLFADDTCLIINDCSPVKLFEKVNEEIFSDSK